MTRTSELGSEVLVELAQFVAWSRPWRRRTISVRAAESEGPKSTTESGASLQRPWGLVLHANSFLLRESSLGRSPSAASDSKSSSSQKTLIRPYCHRAPVGNGFSRR